MTDGSAEYWEARYELERRKRRTECDKCERAVMFDASRTPARPTLKQTTIAFRCRVCARVFCRECAVEHFGLEEDELWDDL